jgi:hypothetical protein
MQSEAMPLCHRKIGYRTEDSRFVFLAGVILVQGVWLSSLLVLSQTVWDSLVNFTTSEDLTSRAYDLSQAESGPTDTQISWDAC